MPALLMPAADACGGLNSNPPPDLQHSARHSFSDRAIHGKRHKEGDKSDVPAMGMEVLDFPLAPNDAAGVQQRPPRADRDPAGLSFQNLRNSQGPMVPSSATTYHAQTPHRSRVRASQFSAGRCFVSGAKPSYPGFSYRWPPGLFNSSGMYSRILAASFPITRPPSVPRGSTGSHPAPVPATAEFRHGSADRPARIRSGPCPGACGAVPKESPLGCRSRYGSFGGIRVPRGDPSKLSALFSDPEKGRALREWPPWAKTLRQGFRRVRFPLRCSRNTRPAQ